MNRENCRKPFQWILGLVAAHSIGFGVALIVLPADIIGIFGFTLSEKFFAVQGGLFHLIISYAYIASALDPEGSEKMVTLSVFAKFAATIFLVAYYFFEKPIIIVLLSGMLDFFMGLAILMAYLAFRGKIMRRWNLDQPDNSTGS